MLEVNRGIRQAAKELEEKGIELLVREGLSVDEEEQLGAIDALVKEGIHGLAVMPVDCESIRMKLNWLIEEKKIPVVTFNSDIVGTKRSCYVGMDNRQLTYCGGASGDADRRDGKDPCDHGIFQQPCE